jgi:peptide/nickel transport system substrate-binding protein
MIQPVRYVLDATVSSVLRLFGRCGEHCAHRATRSHAVRETADRSLALTRGICCFAAVLGLAAALTACGGNSSTGKSASTSTGGSSKPYAELRWGMAPFPGQINWITNQWGQSAQAEALVVQNLVEFEPDGKLKLGLASSFEHPNALTYVYKIKSGVKFSDGNPLTVADVVYSLRHAMAGKESAAATYWKDAASVEPRGASTVVIKLKKPNAAWQDIVAYSSQIIEKSQAEKVSEKELGTPGHLLIGTGPWKFDRFTPSVSVTFSRNPYWTGPRPSAAKITINYFKEEAAMALALRSGAIDGASAYGSPRQFENIPGTRALPSAPEWTDFLSLNTATPPFNNIYVRRAIAYATDTSGMIKAFYPNGDATETSTIIPANMFAGFNSQQVNAMIASLKKYDFDLSAAKRELAKSPYPHGFTTELQVVVNEPLLVSAAQILAADLAKIKINAKVKIVQLDEFSSVYGTKMKLGFIEFGSAYADPDGILQALFAPSLIPPAGVTNWAEYRNAEVDKLLSQQLETTNPAKRLQLIGKLLGIVAEEVPYRLILAHRTFATLSNKYVFPSFSVWAISYTPWAMDVKLAQ